MVDYFLSCFFSLSFCSQIDAGIDIMDDKELVIRGKEKQFFLFDKIECWNNFFVGFNCDNCVYVQSHRMLNTYYRELKIIFLRIVLCICLTIRLRSIKVHTQHRPLWIIQLRHQCHSTFNTLLLIAQMDFYKLYRRHKLPLPYHQQRQPSRSNHKQTQITLAQQIRLRCALPLPLHQKLTQSIHHRTIRHQQIINQM